MFDECCVNAPEAHGSVHTPAFTEFATPWRGGGAELSLNSQPV